MNYETYFPEQRHLLSLTTFRRDRLLPLDAGGSVEVARGDRVDLHAIIARGTAPAPYSMIDAAKHLRLRKPEQLEAQLRVSVGDPVEVGEILAGNHKRRKRNVLSPINGTVAYIGAGRIILRANSDPITVEAGLTGQIVEVKRGRGAVIEGIGAVVQGAWGNDERALGTLRTEPENGFENIHTEDLGSPYRGAIVVTRRPLRALTLRILAEQELAGIIAPSAEPELLPEMLAHSRAILLTEGFGALRMGGTLYSFLINLQGRQVTLDAARPTVLEARRPEAIITVPVNPGERPSAPHADYALQRDTQVRLTRGNFSGSVGQVTDLPKSPILLDNGLRVFCAQVQLITGETLFVPLENLETFG
jgi:hypothetical protein